MKNAVDEIGIGERVKHIRENVLGLKQKEFADLVGLGSDCTVSRIENGTQVMDVSTLRRIIISTGVTSDWILSGNGITPGRSACGIEEALMFNDDWLRARYGIGMADVELISCNTNTCIPVINRRDIVVVNKANIFLKDEGYYVVISGGQKTIRRMLPIDGDKIRVYVGVSDISYYDTEAKDLGVSNIVTGKVIMVIRQI